MLEKLCDEGPTQVLCTVGTVEPQTSIPDQVPYNPAIDQMVPDMYADDQAVFCTGCGTRIVDRYFLLVAEQHWHVPCLRCIDCNIQLDSQLTCFARDGNIFCKQDYYRRYSARRCARCNIGVSSHELVMRTRDLIFHMDCFTCITCSKPLRTGDKYGLDGAQVFCEADYELWVNNYQWDEIDQTAQCLNAPIEMIEFYNSIESLQKGRPRKRKHMLSPGSGCLQTLGLLTNERGDIIPRDRFGTSVHPPRQKRVRTSFKHTQLRTMKSYFALNHNPDAKDLKQLSQKTQLNKRVLQVWFQNARAKYRRGIAKQDGETSETGGKSERSEDSEQLLDLSNRQSPALSDMSSSQSLTDSMDMDLNETGHSADNLVELFSDGTISS